METRNISCYPPWWYIHLKVYLFHIPVYIYRVGMRRPSCTSVPSSCLRFPAPGSLIWVRTVCPDFSVWNWGPCWYCCFKIWPNKSNWFKKIGISIWASSWENLTSGFATRVDSNRPGQLQKLGRGFKFRIQKLEVLYYLGSEQQRWMHRLVCAFVVRIWHKQVFSWCGSY